MKTPKLLALAALLALCTTALASVPVIPAPGQTVTWTPAMNPITFSGSFTVPASGTVLIDPGTELFFNNGSRLFVDGTLTATGTPGNPVVIQGQPAGWLVTRGQVNLSFCTIDSTIAQGSNGTFHITDSLLGPSSGTVTDLISGPIRAIIERCTVQTPFFLLSGEVLLRDVDVQGVFSEIGGYPVLDGVTFTNTSVRLWRELQPMFVENLSVAGVTTGPGLLLDGDTDFLIDSSVSLTGNLYPVQTKGAGLHTGSVVPQSGNVNDAILGFEGNKVHKGAYTMPDLGLPYHFLENISIAGPLAVEPGTTIKMGSSGGLLFFSDFFRRSSALRGLPGAPIVFEPITPAQGWLALGGAGGTYLFEHLVIDGAGTGVAAPQAQVWINESIVRNCTRGAEPSGLGGITAAGVQFRDNQIGALGDMSLLSGGGLFLDGLQRPNVFVGNGSAVEKGSFNSAVISAEGNWWDDPTGPFESINNPAGQGGLVGFQVDFNPWLPAAPDLSDTPPIVRIDAPFFLADPREVMLIQWDVSDDVGVVSQDILIDLKGGGQADFQPLVQGLAGDVTQYAFVMPDPGFNVFARPGLLRVVATDSAGQSSFDEVTLHVSSSPYNSTFQFNTDLSGEWEPLERFMVCWSAFGVASGSLRVHLVLEGDERMDLGPAGNAGDSCTFSNLIIPYVSTDTARLAVIADGNGNIDEWYFSDNFTIRPTALLGNAAPTVTMLSPVGGELFAAGATLPVQWTAADDEPMRGFKIQVSLNAGRTWHTVERDLPGEATSFDWAIPPGIDVSDARVRVIAVDRRFQNSSDGTATSFAITGAAPWLALGPGLAGSNGIPTLSGSGTLIGGALTTVTLAQGLPGATGWLIVGAAELSTPFKGGVLVPVPDVISSPLTLDGSGTVQLDFSWPSGVSSGTELYWQGWIADVAGPAGFSASNGLKSTTP